MPVMPKSISECITVAIALLAACLWLEQLFSR